MKQAYFFLNWIFWCFAKINDIITNYNLNVEGGIVIMELLQELLPTLILFLKHGLRFSHTEAIIQIIFLISYF